MTMLRKESHVGYKHRRERQNISAAAAIERKEFISVFLYNTLSLKLFILGWAIKKTGGTE